MNRKPYQQTQAATWWFKNPYYRFYMLREATSVPVFLYAVWLMLGLFRFSQGAIEFNGWLALNTSGIGQLLHLIVFAAALLHAYTWFQLTPKILVLRLGSLRVPDNWVMIGHYVVWVLVTIGMLWLAIAG